MKWTVMKWMCTITESYPFLQQLFHSVVFNMICHCLRVNLMVIKVVEFSLEAGRGRVENYLHGKVSTSPVIYLLRNNIQIDFYVIFLKIIT